MRERREERQTNNQLQLRVTTESSFSFVFGVDRQSNDKFVTGNEKKTGLREEKISVFHLKPLHQL